jgi:hypothetical protein
MLHFWSSTDCSPANEESGNYILTAFLGWSLPTGSYSNGSLHAVITPTIAYGKGFGHFDAQGTFGIAFPIADTNLVGRNYLWNNTFQYRVFRKFWPEVELNSTFFQQGEHDGMKQNFVTPGLVIGRLHVWNRVGFNNRRRIPDRHNSLSYQQSQRNFVDSLPVLRLDGG